MNEDSMDDLLDQAVAIARIPSSASSQPRTQARLNFQNSQTPGTPPAQRVLVRPRPPGNNNGPSQQATSEATPSRQNQNIILVNGQGTRIQRIPGRNNHQRSVSNLNGRTILIQNPQRSGTPGGSQPGRAATDSPVTQAQARPLIRPIRVVQNSQSPNVAGGNRPLVPINRGTPVQGQRIISRTPVSTGGTPSNPPRTIRVVRVGGDGNGPVRLQQVSSTPGTTPRRIIAQQPPATITPQRPSHNPARVSVQCHEPQGSRPGFIVLSSDSVDNLRSTFSQLQRCFSTLYTDILEMDDDQHALIKKLKDIYRKSDTNYRNYLSRNPLKMLDNVKATYNGVDYIPLEQFLRSSEESSPRSSQNSLQPIVIPRQNRSPSNNPRPIVTRIVQQAPAENQSQLLHEVGIKLPAPESKIKVEPVKKTPILLKMQEDQRNVTDDLNINEPFTSMEDVTSRLLPFHCFSYPEIPESDDLLSEEVVFEPLCERLLHRKRNLEEQFRKRFLSDTQDRAFCEDVLMNRLFTESEEAEMAEEREKSKLRKVQTKIPISRATNVVLSNGRPVMRMIAIPSTGGSIPIQPAQKNVNSQIRVHPNTTQTAHIQVSAHLPAGVNGTPSRGNSGSNLQSQVSYVNENEQAVQNLLDEF